MKQLFALCAASVLAITGCASSGSKPAATVASSSNTIPAPASTADTTAQQVSAWWAGATEAAFSTWAGDLDKVSTAVTGGDPVNVRAACDQMSIDVLKFEDHLPAPDATINREMKAAADDALAASAACSTDDYATTTAKIGSMSAHLAIATARIKILSGA